MKQPTSRRPRFRHLGQCPAAPGAFRSPRRSFAAGCQGTGTDPAGAREEARRKLETMGKPWENHGKTMIYMENHRRLSGFIAKFM